MSARRDRLTRLLAVRRVRLAIVARALANATTAASIAVATASRLGALRSELDNAVGRVDGYSVKAGAATRGTLAAAEVNQRARRADADARRATIEIDLRHKRVGVDATARAVDRAASVGAEPE